MSTIVVCTWLYLTWRIFGCYQDPLTPFSPVTELRLRAGALLIHWMQLLPEAKAPALGMFSMLRQKLWNKLTGQRCLSCICLHNSSYRESMKQWVILHLSVSSEAPSPFSLLVAFVQLSKWKWVFGSLLDSFKGRLSTNAVFDISNYINLAQTVVEKLGRLQFKRKNELFNDQKVGSSNAAPSQSVVVPLGKTLKPSCLVQMWVDIGLWSEGCSAQFGCHTFVSRPPGSSSYTWKEPPPEWINNQFHVKYFGML